MTIKKRLLISNIAMIIIPILAFLMIEIILGYIMFVVFGGTTEDSLHTFLTIRFIALLAVVMVTNGVLTFIVARSIIKPINQLSDAAQEITEGNLNFSIEIKGKDEISQLAMHFETMRKKLKEIEDLNTLYEHNRKQLIANISHDLKTPITSIKGYVNGIRDGVANTPEKMEKYTNTILTKANELDNLIDELFMYSKLNLNKMPFYFELLDLQLYLTDYVEELQFDLEEKGTEVHFQADGDEQYLVKADRDKINRVMMNIIDNSLKYMDKEKRKITIALSVKANFVQVQIKDNGSGINKNALAYIFEQFYRTDESRNSATGGSGIGLAIVKSIIEEHGGKVWAESEEGIGTSVYFTLPKAGDGN